MGPEVEKIKKPGKVVIRAAAQRYISDCSSVHPRRIVF